MVLFLGAKLRYLRHLRQITQADLATELGNVGRAHLGNVETDSRPPSLLLILQVAQFFNVTTEYLLRDTLPIDSALLYPLDSAVTQASLPALLGTKVRFLRQQHGLSQVELAKQLGLSNNAHMSQIERGNHAPSIDLVRALADRFRVTTDELLWDSLSVQNLQEPDET